MVKFIDAHFAMLAERDNSYTQRISCISSKKQEYNQKKNETFQLLKSALATLEKLENDELEDHLCETSKLHHDFHQTVQDNTAKHQEITETLNQNISTVNDHEKESEALFQGLSACQESYSKVKDVCKSIGSEEKGVMNDLTSHFESSATIVDIHEQKLAKAENLWKNEKSRVAERQNEYLKQVEEDKSVMQNKCTECNLQIDEQQDTLLPYLNNLVCQVSETEKHRLEHEKMLHKEILERDVDVIRFLDGLQKDIPTGSTPERKEYTFPRIFAATSPHARILQRFRSQLAVNEANAVDLPLDSSLEDSTDSSPLSSKPGNRTTLLSVPTMSYSSDESNAFDSDASMSSQYEVVSENNKNKSNNNKENQRSTKKASKLPRRKNIPKKIFLKPLPVGPFKKPLSASNEHVPE